MKIVIEITDVAGAAHITSTPPLPKLLAMADEDLKNLSRAELYALAALKGIAETRETLQSIEQAVEASERKAAAVVVGKRKWWGGR